MCGNGARWCREYFFRRSTKPIRHTTKNRTRAGFGNRLYTTEPLSTRKPAVSSIGSRNRVTESSRCEIISPSLRWYMDRWAETALKSTKCRRTTANKTINNSSKWKWETRRACIYCFGRSSIWNFSSDFLWIRRYSFCDFSKAKPARKTVFWNTCSRKNTIKRK